MSLSRDEETNVRRYFLGELEPLGAQALEERLLNDDAFVEQFLLLEDELIEDYARGALTQRERGQFEGHFLSTPKRKRKLMLVNGVRKYAAGRGSSAGAGERGRAGRLSALIRSLFFPRWRAVALAVLIAAAGFGVWRVFFQPSQVERGMLALNDAYRKRRPLETRITGMSYAPFPVTRGDTRDEVDYRARDLSANFLLDAASKKQTVPALHALGRLYLTQKEFDKAILQFQEALRAAPDDAQLHSDLGVALLETGRKVEQGADAGKALETYAESLQHINRAVQLDPDLLEPLYNRALVLERQMLPEQAREAWRLYLSVDARSRWAEEAREHLRLLSERGAAPQTSQQLLADFMAAARARDDGRAWPIMSRNREMITGKFLPQQLAIIYLRESAEGHSRESLESLDILTYAGRLELERARDPYVSELAAYYGRSDPQQRTLLGEAQGRVAAGYGLCLQTKFREALEQFVRAKELFESAGDGWEGKLCDYWVGYCYSQVDRIGESTALLSALAEYCQRKNYKWLLGQATCWIATNYAEMGDHSKSIEYYNRALPVVEEIEDAYNAQKVLSQMSSQYNRLGQPRRALVYNWRSLRLTGPGDSSVRQQWRNYLYTTRTFNNLKLYDAAAAFGSEMLHVALHDIGEADVIHYSYYHLGQIYGGLKRYEEGIRLISESVVIARSLKDESAARKQGTYSMLQLAHLQRQAGRCAQALGGYDEVIRTYDQMELGIYKYDARKGRLLCHIALKNDPEVEAELPVVLGHFDRYRSTILAEQDRNTFFDREQGVYDIAINHAYTKGDVQRAFNYSEASRSRSLLDVLLHGVPAAKPSPEADAGPAPPAQPLGLTEIQRRLPPDVQVLQYAVLEEKTIIWLITRESVKSTQSDITATALHSKISTYLTGLNHAPVDEREDVRGLAKELYDALVGPVAGLLDPEKVLCVIPDKSISLLPFTTLVSPATGRYLINELSLLSSPSLNVFLHCTESSRGRAGASAETLLVVGNPAFDAAAYPGLQDLPGAAREARGVAELYRPHSEFSGPHAVRGEIERVLPGADVIHFAGHYIPDERDPMSSRLVLAPGRGPRAGEDDGSLTARELVGRNLTRAKFVVLSACQTGVGSYYNGEGMVSISRTFLGTGVPLVVASQWAVDSEATAELMLKFHRYRKVHGLATVAALRRAQLDMSSEPGGRYRDPYYWAGFLPIGGLANY